MNRSKFIHAIIFCVYTYAIANSMLFAMGLANAERLRPRLCLIGFIYIFCQWSLLELWPDSSQRWGMVLFFFALVGWDIAIFSYPLLRWSRKKTVFNAWLVAIAGALIPQYIWTFFCYPPDYTLNAFWTMNAGYAIAWIIEQAWRRSIRIEEERRAQKHDAASRQ